MFSENLRALMKLRKITSRSLAQQSGISETYISYMLTGKKKPSFAMLEKIAEALLVPMSDLVTKERPPTPERAEALLQKYGSLLRSLESMDPARVEELTARIEAAAPLFPREDAPDSPLQPGASSGHQKKIG